MFKMPHFLGVIWIGKEELGSEQKRKEKKRKEKQFAGSSGQCWGQVKFLLSANTTGMLRERPRILRGGPLRATQVLHAWVPCLGVY